MKLLRFCAKYYYLTAYIWVMDRLYWLAFGVKLWENDK